MKVVTVNGQNYRLPNGLNPFQQAMYVCMINWKWKNITRAPGDYRGIPYDAILPKHNIGQYPMLYPPIIPDFQGHFAKYPFKVHPHFNHVASSQAANINLFLPILRHPRAADILRAVNKDFASLATQELFHGYRIEYWDEPYGILELIDLLAKEKYQTLASRFAWDYLDLVYERYTPTDHRRDSIPLKHLNLELDTLEHDDTPAITQAYIQYKINHAVQQHTSACLSWNADRQRYSTYLTCKSLLGALWLQCANLFTQEDEYTQCQHCQKWYQLSPVTGKRLNTRYCSLSCKQQAYYRRRKKRELYQPESGAGIKCEKTERSLRCDG